MSSEIEKPHLSYLISHIYYHVDSKKGKTQEVAEGPF